MAQRQNKATELETEDKLLNIRKKYNTEFGRALNAEKINSFFRSEREFGDYVKKEMMQRREMRERGETLQRREMLKHRETLQRRQQLQRQRGDSLRRN